MIHDIHVMLTVRVASDFLLPTMAQIVQKPVITVLTPGFTLMQQNYIYIYIPNNCSHHKSIKTDRLSINFNLSKSQLYILSVSHILHFISTVPICRRDIVRNLLQYYHWFRPNICKRSEQGGYFMLFKGKAHYIHVDFPKKVGRNETEHQNKQGNLNTTLQYWLKHISSSNDRARAWEVWRMAAGDDAALPTDMRAELN